MPAQSTLILPQDYFTLSEEAAMPRIAEARRRLGRRLMILGHHYQRDEVIQFADKTGDSFGLSRQAAANQDAETIVFCGVHFMAESADILTRPEQAVILPDMAAGCSMADMADLAQVEDAWDEIADALGDGPGVMPITYINSAADLKAFVGLHGGAVCTSSNAAPVIRWGLSRRAKLLFFPDQHLGRNTAAAMGIPLDEMVVWDPRRPAGSLGGNTPESLRRARIILWRGHCQVHQRFLPEHVRSFRDKFPGIQVIVHPECSYEVVQMADLSGSTSFIIDTITRAPSGTSWAVGTEIHLVDRLRRAHPDKFISSLVPGVCLCSTMNRIDPQHLLWVLEELERGEIVNRIKVPEPVASRARLALDRMLAIS
ncbi:MAG TPA: quinolinate synthase NadA [Candidatus Polarisedimenticolia bacterium]|nr:quinolinate synthase NadA [Candidatus Polarisedimenticolia bacterium]